MGSSLDGALSAESIFPLVYDQLRDLAGRYARLRPGAGVAPSSIVHEVFVRMQGAASPCADREHFCAIAAVAMRQILADRARRDNADKRGGDWERVTLTDLVASGKEEHVVELAALDAALSSLEALHPRQARIVELRFFGGLTVPEVARHLDVSESTVEKEWRRARAWLSAALTEAA